MKTYTIDNKKVSKATYYRLKTVSNETVSQESHTKDETVVFNGTNGNKCKNITRAQMAKVIDNNPNAFIPNWYAIGSLSRN